MVEEAILATFGRSHTLVEEPLPAEVLSRAAELQAQHEVGIPEGLS
jgi:hypothetical protein